MKAVGITDQGLLVIGLLVLLLWGMIFAERALVEKAQRDYEEYRRSQPTSAPAVEQSAPGAEMPIIADPLGDLTVS